MPVRIGRLLNDGVGANGAEIALPIFTVEGIKAFTSKCCI
jgi:hypothetical protein